MKKYIIIQGNVLEYELQRKDVKNINLRIHEDKSIFVSANKSVPASKVEKFLISRQEFILSTLQRFDEMSKIKDRCRNLNDGDTYPILGEDKNLIVVQGLRQAFIKDNLLIISVEDVNCLEEKEMVLERLKKKIAIQVVTDICRKAYPHYRKYVSSFPSIKFRKMKTMWGSCRPKSNVLTFNTKLAEMPAELIEYVVFHEFTHFIEANHSPKFYNALEKFMPDWKKRRNKLKEFNGI